MSRRLRALLAVGTTLVAGFALAAPAGSAPAEKVRVTIAVHGCDTCSVQAVQADGEAGTLWHTTWKRVDRSGEVTFRVPVSRTRGMVFAIDAPWSTTMDGTAYVVTRYDGVEAGDRVTSREAARSAAGTWCWAGSRHARTIEVQVDRFRYEWQGEQVTGMRAFASPALPTDDADLTGTFEGALWTQYPFC
jgi:hypothetical protein